MVLRLRQPIRRIGNRRATTRRSFQRGGCLPNPARIALLLEESHLRGGPVLLRQSPCAGGTRKAGRCLPAGSYAEGHTNFPHHNSSTFSKAQLLFLQKCA